MAPSPRVSFIILSTQGWIITTVSISCVVQRQDVSILALLDMPAASNMFLVAVYMDWMVELPTFALGHTANPRLARPPTDWEDPIYLQPMDTKDPAHNMRNIQAVTQSCMKHGYRLQLQIHKYIGVE